MKKRRQGNLKLSMRIIALVFPILLLQAGRGQALEFPKSVKGQKNPQITWAMEGEEFMLVLGWQSDYDQTLTIAHAFLDRQGYINVEADTSCTGCLIRLYQKEGDSWNRLDEKKAQESEIYTLRGMAKGSDVRFPMRVSGSDNPEIVWNLDGEQFRLVLGWKSDRDQTLSVQEAFLDAEGRVHVKAETSCNGCYMRLYRREGASWSKLDEKQAQAQTAYTLSGIAQGIRVQFPKTVSGQENPQIAWTMAGEELRLALGWKSDFSQTLTIEEASVDDKGVISVKATTSCHGCTMRLYRRDGDSWKKVDEKKSQANEMVTLRPPVSEVGRPPKFPIRESSNRNPTITWEMEDHRFRLELWWQDPLESRWVEITDAQLTDKTLTIAGNTSCDDCWVALYQEKTGSWEKAGIVKAAGNAFTFGFVMK